MLYRRFPLPAAGPIHTPAAFGSPLPDHEKRLPSRHWRSPRARPPRFESGHISTTRVRSHWQGVSQ
jgi:hypothetical protein